MQPAADMLAARSRELQLACDQDGKIPIDSRELVGGMNEALEVRR